MEPNRAAYNVLLARHRAAVAINSCLSVEDKPNIVEFDAADVFGGINKDMENVNNNALARVSLSNTIYSK